MFETNADTLINAICFHFISLVFQFLRYAPHRGALYSSALRLAKDCECAGVRRNTKVAHFSNNIKGNGVRSEAHLSAVKASRENNDGMLGVGSASKAAFTVQACCYRHTRDVKNKLLI